MARRIIVKKILSGIPNITKLTGLSDINDSGLSGTNGYLKYDSASQKFNFVSLASITSGVSTVNSLNGAITIAGAGTVSVGTAGSTITITGSGGGAGGVDSAAVNTLIAAADTHDSAAVKGQIDSAVNASFINALTIDADTLGGQNSAYHLNYNNFTNKPTIPTVDSATILPLARAAITAGSNITYDSATGVISSTGGGAGGADSTSVQGQIDSAVTIAFINSLSGTLDADTLGGNDSAYYLNYNNFTNKPTIPTVDSATIQPFARAAITAGSNITYDSATGVIASTASGGTDSATVVSIADSRIGISSIGALSNVDLTGISTNNILKWDGAKFVAAVDATSGGGSGIALSDLSAADAGGFGSFAYNNVSGVFTYTGADSAAIKTVTSIPYANLTGTPTIPTVDSAAIRPFARAAITAGSNITYDSATGVIAAVIGDTQDSAAVQGQIDSSINNDIIGTSNEVEVNGTGGVATIGLPAAVQITTSLTVGGNAVLTTASDTHDSAAVKGQIDSAVTIAFINSLTGTLDADTLGGNDSSYYLNYNNFINNPSIPALYSDFIDSSQAIIIADARIAAADTHDSNLVLGQINSIVDFNFITAAGKADSAYIKTVTGIDADTLDNLNSTEFLRSNTKDQKTAGSLVMNDGIAIKFGTDSDHSISEVSGNLEINTVGTTFFKVNTAGLRLHNQAGTENLLTASQNGAVALYYDNVQRAITTNTGLNITGFLDADSIQTTHIDIFDVVHHKPTAQNAGAGQTTVKAFPHLSVPCSIEYSIHMKDVNGTTTKGETSYTKVVATLDSGLNTAYTEFSTLFTGDSEFGTFDVDADATNINLKFTRRSGRDGTVRVQTAKTVIGGDG